MQIQHILKGLLASVMFTVTLASPMNSTIQESGKSTKRATGVSLIFVHSATFILKMMNRYVMVQVVISIFLAMRKLFTIPKQ